LKNPSKLNNKRLKSDFLLPVIIFFFQSGQPAAVSIPTDPKKMISAPGMITSMRCVLPLNEEMKRPGFFLL
jgi:hypothetical protein